MNQNEIDSFVAGWIQEKYKDDLASDRFKSLPESEKAEILAKADQRERSWILKQIARVENRDLDSINAFHPDNKLSRRLFAHITGIQLPSGAEATRQAVMDYVGRDRIEAAEQERIAAEQAALAAEESERIAAVEAIIAKIVAGESVSGGELADAAKHVGLSVHIRTIGTLRQRVISMDGNGARVRKTKASGFKLPQSCYDLYAAVRADRK